jgi:Domain of unknown function (DUF4913)
MTGGRSGHPTRQPTGGPTLAEQMEMLTGRLTGVETTLGAVLADRDLLAEQVSMLQGVVEEAGRQVSALLAVPPEHNPGGQGDPATRDAGDDAGQAADSGARQADTPAEGSPPEPLDMNTLAAWVDEVLSEVYIRPVGRLRWCATWFEHPEAVVRLEACRRAWLDLCSQPGTGPSVWHRDHLDPMLAELLSSDGPFRNCEAQPGTSDTAWRHELPDRLPVEPLDQLPNQPPGPPQSTDATNPETTTPAAPRRPASTASEEATYT